jgi:hypothetical protein
MVAVSVGVARFILAIQALFFGSIATFIFLNFSRDVENYRSLYDRVSEVDLYWLSSLEPSSLLLFYLASSLNLDFMWFIGVLLTIALYAKLSVLRNFSNNYLISLLFYLSWFYLLHDATQFRLALATPFFLMSFYFTSSKEYLKAYIFGLVGISFHYSISFYIFFIAFNHLVTSFDLKRQNILLITLLLLSLIIFYFGGIASLLINIGQAYIPEKILLYFERGGIIGISFKQGFILTMIILILPFSNSLDDLEKLAFRSVIFSMICNLVFSDLPILAVRLSELFFLPFLFILPTLVKKYKPKEVSKVVLFLLCFLIFFYHMITGLFVFHE